MATRRVVRIVRTKPVKVPVRVTITTTTTMRRTSK
jgi:hypothetical protein